MKILVVADTHGELQPHQLPQETLFIKPDGIFLLGDVFINDIELLKQFYPTVSILGVGGNHDKWDLLKSVNVQDIHGRVIRWNGLYIAGFGGAYKCLDKDEYMMHSQKDAMEQLSSMPSCDILLTHDQSCLKAIPAEGQIDGDSKTGLIGITEYIDKNQPKLHLHGHTHESGTDWRNMTCIRSFYGVELIDLEL